MNGSGDRERPIVIVFGLIVILGILWGGYRYLRGKAQRVKNIQTVSGSAVSTSGQEKKLLEKTKLEVPEEGDKIALKDVVGGEAIGVARRVKKDNRYEISVIADLSEPGAGEFYEGWVVVDGKETTLGRLLVEKGGYIVEKVLGDEVKDKILVVVSLEKKDDGKIEKKVLEGSL